MAVEYPDNDDVADILDEVSDILEFRAENEFRIRAYRRAADRIRDFDRPIAKLYERRGRDGLRDISGIGDRLSASIGEIIDTGQLGMLTRLQTELSPVEVFSRLPGVGPTLADRIVEHLEVESLEELERAAHDSRLQQVPGIAAAKATGIGYALAGMLNRGARRRARDRVRREQPSDSQKPQATPPAVELLLSLDAEYRRKARAGRLRQIAPRRFNPDDKTWLPIMEVQQEGRHFTVLFSNTRRAHELERTHDWVVIYAENGDNQQFTVVTATSGSLRDKRVVRGREQECRHFYEQRRYRDRSPRF